MVATIAQSERDQAKIVFTLRQIADQLNRQPALMIGGYSKNIDLNSANTDNSIIIAPIFPYYSVHSVLVKNTGTTASLTTATAGLFTAAAAGGTALAANQALSSIVSKTVDVNNNMLFLTLAVSKMWMDYTTLYFRVGTAQGAAATADVYVYIQPMP